MLSYTRREWLIVSALSLAIFTGTLNVYLLTPFLKLIAADFGVSESTAGQLSATYALAAGFVGLVVAPLVDRYQRKRLLYLAVTIVSVATVLSATARAFPVLLFAHGLAGFGAAFGGSSCFAIATDAFPDETKRNRCVGILISAGGVTAIIGVPILTHIAAAAGWRAAVASLLVPCLLAALAIMVLPKRNLPRRTRFLNDYLASYRRVLRNRQIVWLYVATLALATAETAPLIYSASIWNGLFNLSLQNYGWIFLIGGSGYAIGSNFAPVLLRRLPARLVSLIAGGLQLTAALAFPFLSASLPAALLAYAGVLVSMSAINAVAMNVLLQDALPADRGAVLSLDGTVIQTGVACAAIFGGIILASIGYVAIIPVINLLVPVALLAVWRMGSHEPATRIKLEPIEPSLQ